MTLGVVFYTLNRAPAPIGDNIFFFYLTGVVPFLMFTHVSQDVMGSAEANNALLQLPIVKRTDVMVAQALRQFATELWVGIIIFGHRRAVGRTGRAGRPADRRFGHHAAVVAGRWHRGHQPRPRSDMFPSSATRSSRC